MSSSSPRSRPTVVSSDVDELLAHAENSTPFPHLLRTLMSFDPQNLSYEQLVGLLVGLDKQAAHLAAFTAEVTAALVTAAHQQFEVAGLDPDVTAKAVTSEVAAALRISSSSAQHRIDTAVDLQRLPAVAKLMKNGKLSYSHARVVIDECAALDTGQCARVEAHIIDRAPDQTPAQLRRSVRRAIAAIAPPTTEELVEREYAKRSISLQHDGGVMATLVATLPTPDAVSIWNSLTRLALAENHDRDTRTIDHKRVDALITACQTTADSPDLPVIQGRKRLETQIVIDLPTLLGLADNPAELVGYGPIPAPIARHLAADSRWRRLVTDPVTGHLLDYGTTTYTPPAKLREYLLARDRTCRFPGCNRRAELSDLDHAIHYTGDHAGGTTSADNLWVLCRTHHNHKTAKTWDITFNTTNTVTWTSPAGRTYTSQPPPQLGSYHLLDEHPRSHLERELADLLRAPPIG